ncbi:MAG: AraC family transcriptional regulator [Lachnospiraceae bacterium]|nr:AraC family transcriptional regulator [Lachnospiraceae bacterium]
MFDNLHFYTRQVSIPCTEQNYQDVVPFYSDKGLLTDHRNASPSLMQGSFYIDGTIHVCPPHPTSSYAREHLFCMQAFSILEVGSRYFTRRAGLDSYLLLFTYEGAGFLEYEGKSYELRAGDGFWINCRKPHYYGTREGTWKHGDLHLEGAFIDRIFQEFVLGGTVVFSFPEAGSFQDRLEQLLKLYDGLAPHRELQISNAIENLLMMLLLESPQYRQDLCSLPENIRYLVKYMEHNYTHPLTLDFLSDFAGISKYHLTRIFHIYVGYTPGEYLIQLRMEQARHLLRSTSLPISGIGPLVGIENENYFCRLFKAKVGVSPGKYRNNSKNYK